MVSRLLIMRHAKSSWDDPAQTDHERPLNKRGRRSAEAIGKVLTAKSIAPQLIWSSDAQRTRETATLLIRAIPGAQTVLHSSSFYHASAQTALDTAASLGEPGNIETLMWLGHNPGWSALFEYFTGFPHDFPTGACLVLERKKDAPDWLSNQSWVFKEMILPRDLLG